MSDKQISIDFSPTELRMMASLLLHLRRQNAFDIEDDIHVPVSQIAWQLERVRRRLSKAVEQMEVVK